MRIFPVFIISVLALTGCTGAQKNGEGDKPEAVKKDTEKKAADKPEDKKPKPEPKADPKPEPKADPKPTPSHVSKTPPVNPLFAGDPALKILTDRVDAIKAEIGEETDDDPETEIEKCEKDIASSKSEVEKRQYREWIIGWKNLIATRNERRQSLKNAEDEIVKYVREVRAQALESKKLDKAAPKKAPTKKKPTKKAPAKKPASKAPPRSKAPPKSSAKKASAPRGTSTVRVNELAAQRKKLGDEYRALKAGKDDKWKEDPAAKAKLAEWQAVNVMFIAERKRLLAAGVKESDLPPKP
jgi:hypothetical protein